MYRVAECNRVPQWLIRTLDKRGWFTLYTSFCFLIYKNLNDCHQTCIEMQWFFLLDAIEFFHGWFTLYTIFCFLNEKAWLIVLRHAQSCRCYFCCSAIEFLSGSFTLYISFSFLVDKSLSDSPQTCAELLLLILKERNRVPPRLVPTLHKLLVFDWQQPDVYPPCIFYVGHIFSVM